ncbi:helix-turn-helix domain-containing protein [Tumebacillus permanentifrigoris]|uniref:DNA-binding XRE family transcriptional regulator n=1 Tax=Tumebacillus permanentifrigoris TaxID=378543 RepID=A0A316DBQ5_9BACL|nr:helix-turn-helix transcriptional regulator [Tumebacillus permanentifrigoris]PWK15035.1 DNA-binding XRE family transcriptional regulator [Tumebacillus permanentifrigoris]
MSLGTKIRALRLTKGLTQSDLGAGLVTPSMISQIESDKAKPSYKVLEAIATKLEEPLEYFLADIAAQMEQASSFKVARALMNAEKFDHAVSLLENLLEDMSSGLNEAEVRFSLGICYMNLGELERSKLSHEQAIELYESKLDYEGNIKALIQLGLVFKNQKKPHKSIYEWRRSLVLFDNLLHSQPVLKAEVLMHLAAVCNQLGEYQEALLDYQEAYKMLNKTNQLKEIGLLYMEMGSGYAQAQEFEKAGEYAQHAIAIFDALNMIKLRLKINIQYAVSLREQGKAKESLQILVACIETCHQQSLEEELCLVYGEIAFHHYYQSEYDQAREAVQHGLASLSNDSLPSGHLYKTKGRIEAAYGDASLALQNFEIAVTVYIEHNRHLDLATTYKEIADLYERIGDFKKSTQYLNLMNEAYMENLRERGILLT